MLYTFACSLYYTILTRELQAITIENKLTTDYYVYTHKTKEQQNFTEIST